MLASSFVDNALRDRSVHELGKKRVPNSFEARIDLECERGFVEDEFVAPLHIIRAIRNDFGHEPVHLDFDNPAIADQVRTMVFHKIVCLMN